MSKPVKKINKNFHKVHDYLNYYDYNNNDIRNKNIIELSNHLSNWSISNICKSYLFYRVDTFFRFLRDHYYKHIENKYIYNNIDNQIEINHNEIIMKIKIDLQLNGFKLDIFNKYKCIISGSYVLSMINL